MSPLGLGRLGSLILLLGIFFPFLCLMPESARRIRSRKTILLVGIVLIGVGYLMGLISVAWNDGKIPEKPKSPPQPVHRAPVNQADDNFVVNDKIVRFGA